MHVLPCSARRFSTLHAALVTYLFFAGTTCLASKADRRSSQSAAADTTVGNRPCVDKTMHAPVSKLLYLLTEKNLIDYYGTYEADRSQVYRW